MKTYFIYLLLLLPSFLLAQHTVRVERCHSFPENEPVNCLHIEGELIWLGTSKGLFFYSYKNNRRNVLEDVSVTAIARDSTGKLWAALEGGIVMTSDKQHKIDLKSKGRPVARPARRKVRTQKQAPASGVPNAFGTVRGRAAPGSASLPC